jgi:hypothetical protein
MLTASRRLKLGFLVAVLAGVMIVASAGPAVAMMKKLVLSDKVSFKGSYNANGELSSTTCSLTSDGEEGAFPCTVTATVVGIGGPAIEVTSFWASADGEGFFPRMGAPRTASKPPIETYKSKGPCEEREESDIPGTTGEVQYPCMVTFTLKFNTEKHTVVGKYVVREEEKQP